MIEQEEYRTVVEKQVDFMTSISFVIDMTERCIRLTAQTGRLTDRFCAHTAAKRPAARDRTGSLFALDRPRPRGAMNTYVHTSW